MKTIAAIAATIVLASSALGQSNLIIAPGAIFVYDTSAGPLVVGSVVIHTGGVLRASGPNAFHLRASGAVQIDGMIELSGIDSNGVQTLNTSNIPEPGAAGGPGGGKGGTGNPLTTQASPAGDPGDAGPIWPRVGGRGGESGISTSGLGVDSRRPGGGGGGALAADQPADPNPQSPLNLGLVAGAGKNGEPTALGVLSLTPPPLGGGVGDRAFVDSDPTNDFYGMRRLSSGIIQIGELVSPVAGAGGGGGGNAIEGFVWPPTIFTPTTNEKGAGGGGGGGLGILVAPSIALGPGGRIRCNGGRGGGGENTLFLNRVGGGSGGGSGGYLILQARIVDLRLAGDRAITALGGRGGEGKNNVLGAINAGGDGGPGVIAIHIPPPAVPLVPAGKTLADMTAPAAVVLLPDRRF